MPLRKAGLPIQFQGGLSTKEDAKSVPTTQLLDLQNAVFTKETTLSKRSGYEALSKAIDGAGADYANARGLAAHGDELLLFTETNCESYRPSSDTWSDAGEVASTVLSDVQIARTGTQQWIADSATANGVTVIAWEDSREALYISVVEDATGRIMLAQTAIPDTTTAKHPRCIAIGSVVAVIFAQGSELRIVIVNSASPTTSPVASVLVNDLHSSGCFDAIPMPASYAGVAVTATEGGILAYPTASGTYKLAYIAISGVLGSIITGFPSAATFTETMSGPIALAADPTNGATSPIAVVWCADIDTIRGRFHQANSLGTSIRYATELGAGTTSRVVNRITCEFANVEAGQNLPTLAWAAELNASETNLISVQFGKALVAPATYDDSSTLLRGHVLLSRAFHDGPTLSPAAGAMDGYAYVTVGMATRFFPYAMVVRMSDPGLGTASGASDCLPVSRIAPGNASGHLFRFPGGASFAIIQHLPSVEARELTGMYARKHRIPIGVRIQLDSEDGDQFGEQGIRLNTVDFDNANAYQTAELGRGLYLASSCPQQYDGDKWVEADYHTAPDWGFNTTTGAPVDPAIDYFIPQIGTGSMATGTYRYKLWYEDVDNQGELHPGAVSVGVNVTVPDDGENEVAISIPCYHLTRKRRVRLCVARSEQGATGLDETIEFFRVTSTDPSLTSGNNEFKTSDPAVDGEGFIDGLSDALLAKREPLYTNGGILSNDPAPWAGGVIAGGKSRLFWTDPSDPHLVRFSQQVRGDTGLEAPTDLALGTDPYGGAIVGIAVMDENVYPLKETAVYVFGGPGPLADPTVSPEVASFSPADLVTSDVGCSSPATICQTPVGIAFDSAKGIRMLTRQRQIVPIGDPVRAFTDVQEFTRATLQPDRPHIVFLTASGSSLLFDYERGQWSRFTNHEGYSAALVGGVYHYLRTDGRVFAETVDEYRDDNSHIPMVIETAWIKMIQYLQGWQRVHYAKFLGEFKSPHTLRVRYRIDYQAGYSAPFDLDVNVNWDPQLYGEGLYGEGLYGGSESSGTVYQRSIHINRRCQSISFLIEDVEATEDYGASFELSELLLLGGIVRSDFQVGAARSR